MITQQVQIKLNLPLAMKDYVESKASKYDMTLSSYLKHLILTDIKDMDIPVFRISEASEKKALKAIKETKQAKKVSSMKAYLDAML
jgi:antitoxin component of RelBE/YafQ-DinJ toxin-antitoxin module